ncbi:MAG: hypothetical protein V3T78_09560, partial [Dehalococcoidia bacterium]
MEYNPLDTTPRGRANLRVLFLEDVINVANAGEIKEVANGFARNY